MVVAERGKKTKVKAKPQRAFPPDYRRLTHTKKLEWLRGEECGAFVKAGLLQFNQVVAEQRRLEKQRLAIFLIVPSSVALEDWQDGQPFPPPSEHTPMCEADRVLCKQEIPTLWPQAYLRGGETYDVVVFKDLMRRANIDGRRDLNHGTTESPTRVNLDEMERRNESLIQRKLPTEDLTTLAMMVARWMQGKPTKLLTDER